MKLNNQSSSPFEKNSTFCNTNVKLNQNSQKIKADKTQSRPSYKIPTIEDHDNNLKYNNNLPNLNQSPKTNDNSIPNFDDDPILNKNNYVARLNELKKIEFTSKILYLTIINSIFLEKNSYFKISAQGMENSLRNAKDGITYFGDPLITNKVKLFYDIERK